MTTEAQAEIRKRILSALPESGEWLPFNRLLWDLSGGDPASYRPFEQGGLPSYARGDRGTQLSLREHR
jgi:hypothetical protein